MEVTDMFPGGPRAPSSLYNSQGFHMSKKATHATLEFQINVFGDRNPSTTYPSSHNHRPTSGGTEEQNYASKTGGTTTTARPHTVGRWWTTKKSNYRNLIEVSLNVPCQEFIIRPEIFEWSRGPTIRFPGPFCQTFSSFCPIGVLLGVSLNGPESYKLWTGSVRFQGRKRMPRMQNIAAVWLRNNQKLTQKPEIKNVTSWPVKERERDILLRTIICLGVLLEFLCSKKNTSPFQLWKDRGFPNCH